MKRALQCVQSMSTNSTVQPFFSDLSKTFDMVDHTVLKQRLSRAELSEHTVSWSDNHLTDRTQCVQVEGCTSSSLKVTKGVPQGSVLGPLLFILYINNIDQNMSNAYFHFYAEDTVLYCSAHTPDQALLEIHLSFNTV